MRNSFKSKCTINNKDILGKIVFLTVVFIILCTFFLLNKFNKNINNNLNEISKAEIRRVTYNFITERINNKVLNKDVLSDLLIITKNREDEILYVDFDLDKAYKILDSISLVLTRAIKELDNGNISISYLDKDMSKNVEGMILNVPLGSTIGSNFFYNLGPMIPVKINFIGSVLTNLETKVTNYGLNNALVEMFVYIEFHTQILTPFNMEEMELKYDAVIGSMMIEGKVPSFYNGSISKNSEIYSENLEN